MAGESEDGRDAWDPEFRKWKTESGRRSRKGYCSREMQAVFPPPIVPRAWVLSQLLSEQMACIGVPSLGRSATAKPNQVRWMARLCTLVGIQNRNFLVFGARCCVHKLVEHQILRPQAGAYGRDGNCWLLHARDHPVSQPPNTFRGLEGVPTPRIRGKPRKLGVRWSRDPIATRTQ
jgi:hypothetical protein